MPSAEVGKVVRADAEIAAYLGANAYHPRSSKHGDALCSFFLADLIATCPALRNAAARRSIVFQRNYTIDPDSPTRWNVDLVVGPPQAAVAGSDPIVRADPREIWIAVDAKTIMTEHGKARRNRQRDLNSFQDIMHRRHARTIAAGLVLVNLSPKFQTPLARRSGGLNVHKNVERLVAEIVTMLSGLPRAQAAGAGQGIEALGVIVVSHSNLPGEPTTLITAPPAPAPGSALSYSRFVDEGCKAFTSRFTAP